MTRRYANSALFLVVAWVFCLLRSCSAFSVRYPYKAGLQQRPFHCRLGIAASEDNHSDTTPIVGDPLRAATGIRPSLHPTAINAIAQALKLRAKGQLVVVSGGNDQTSNNNPALELALQAGTIAAEAIQQRNSKSKQDGMTLTKEEEQTIAGRVVGVVMRLADMEATLASRVQSVPWIAKYGEWNSFGVVPEETNQEGAVAKDMIQQRIKDDPLFGMNRAECLLALFVHSVEGPQLEKAKQSVPDKSIIDFLDEDRKDVLLQQK